MQNIEGKVALITGAGSGIGEAIANSLARAGAAIAVADIDVAAAERVSEGIRESGGRATPIACDVTSDASIAAAADAAEAELGNIQLLVNNAGAFTVGLLSETSRKDWNWILDINVGGVVNGLHAILPRMQARGDEGHIVNTASVSGHIGVAGLSIYTASKFAVVGLSECLKLELAESRIGVSVLCPGIVKTDLLESSQRHRGEAFGGRGNAPADGGMTQVIESGTDPAEVGERVRQAIQRADFYIFTHPELRPAFQNRWNDILTSYPAA